MKKLIALLLALVLVLSLVACTAKEEPEKEEEKPADSEQKPAEDKKEEDKKDEEKEEEAPADAYVKGTLPLVTEPTVITIGLMQNALTENYDTNEYTLWLEEQTGIDLEFVYFSSDGTEATTQLNLMISGGQELPDILWGMNIDKALMFELGQDGYFLDLNEYFETEAHFYLDTYNLVNEADQAKIFAGATDPVTGALYCFPAYQEAGGDCCVCLNFINQEWLDAVGKEVPTTIDELYDVLKAFAEEDPNGNGEKDELPLVGLVNDYRSDITQFIINAWVYCQDEYLFNVTDGQLWNPYATNEYREALKFLNKLYAEGLLAASTFTMSGYEEMKSILNPVDGAAQLVGMAGSHPTLAFDFNGNDAIFDYVPVAPLKGETELGGYGAMHENAFWTRNFITCDAEDPVTCFRLLDFMSTQESALRQRYGVKGVNWIDAEPGQVSAEGYPATYQLVEDAFQTQNNICWHAIESCFNSFEGWANAYEGDLTTGLGNLERIYYTLSGYYVKAGTPAETVTSLVMLPEEQEVYSELFEVLKDYVRSQRALFISGNLDPNSDADWNTYLAEMEAQGMEDLMASCQTAYTRMNG